MKLIKYHFQNHRAQWGLSAGVISSTLLISWIDNNVLAAVLGTVITLLVAHPVRLKEFVILGCATGIIIGPVVGVESYLDAHKVSMISLPTLLLSILFWIVISGLLGAVYGLVIGKALDLNEKGEGPFF